MAQLEIPVLAIVFLIPIIGMVAFTFRSISGGITLDHWQALTTTTNSFLVTILQEGFFNSLILVVITLLIEYIIVIPAIILIDIRFPRMRRLMAVGMLLPMAVPAVILVVGFAPVFSFIASVIGTNTWSLALSYGVLTMPLVYTTVLADLRGLNALTLVQAAQSLGASWLRTLIAVLLPSLRRSLLSSGLITTAIVFGEFTVASLLNRNTLQTALVAVGKTDVYLSVIVTFITLILTFCALFACSRIGRKQNTQ